MVDTIRTEADLVDNIFPDAQPAGSITAQDVRDFVVSARHLHNMGWQFFLDGAATVGGSPGAQVIPAGQRTLLTIDGGTEISGHPVVPSGGNASAAFWSISENKILPSGVNDFGFVRLFFTASSDAGGGFTNEIDIELDVSGLPNNEGSPLVNGDIIYQQTSIFTKGSGQSQHFNYVIPLFSGPNFQANGGKFYITSAGEMHVWTKAITAARLMSAVQP